jgi:hypothetical protein
LNPAVQAEDELWTAPRAVCLVGGTLQPLGVMMQELFPQVASHAMDAERTWHRQEKALVGSTNRQQLHLKHLNCTKATNFGPLLVDTWSIVHRYCCRKSPKSMILCWMFDTSLGQYHPFVMPLAKRCFASVNVFPMVWWSLYHPTSMSKFWWRHDKKGTTRFGDNYSLPHR